MRYDASKLPRIVQCGASKTMPTFTPVGMDIPDDDREAGIAAHWLAMEVITGKLPDAWEMVDRKAPNGFYISDEMAEHATTFATAIRNRRGDRYVEQPATLQLSPDLIIDCRPDVVTDDERGETIYIDDFKYGWRLVEIENNWTMLAYAMAFASVRSFNTNVTFQLTIHQPRPHHPDGNVRSIRFTLTQLVDIRRQLMELLTVNTTMLRTGPECGHCPAITNCVPAQKMAYNIIDLSESVLAHTMSPAQMSVMLDNLTTAQKRLKDYQTSLEERVYSAVRSGVTVPNYMVEPTIGNLEWNEWVTPEILQVMTDRPTTKTKMITPTQAKAILGEDAIKSMADRPKKGSKLVRFDPQKLATKMFGKGK